MRPDHTRTNFKGDPLPQLDRLRTLAGLYPTRVKPELRAYLLDKYPALAGDSELSAVYRDLLQRVLFNPFLDDRTGLPVLSQEVVHLAAGYRPNNGKVAATHALAGFCRDIFDLQLRESIRPEQGWHGRCRLVGAPLDAELQERIIEQCAQIRREGTGNTVRFDTGEPVSARQAEREKKAQTAALALRAAETPADHPAAALLSHLNANPGRVLRKYYRANSPAINDRVNALPMFSKIDRDRRLYVERLLAGMGPDGGVLRYHGTEGSPRLFAIGANVNALPRELRRLALKGTTNLDLRACQLAVVARLYDCPKLLSFLESDRNYWSEILEYLGLEPERKGILKDATFALCFGMKYSNLKMLLRTGKVRKGRRIKQLTDDPGLGSALAEKFLRHPLIAELIDKRDVAEGRVLEAGGAVDAWETWVPLRTKANSLLAYVAQSYEVRLMLAALPVVQRSPAVSLVSLIHDGLYLHPVDPRRSGAAIAAVCRAVDREASDMGIPTVLL